MSGSRMSLLTSQSGAVGVVVVLALSSLTLLGSVFVGQRYVALKNQVTRIDSTAKEDRYVRDLLASRASVLKNGTAPNDLVTQCAPQTQDPATIPRVPWPPAVKPERQIQTTCASTDSSHQKFILNGYLRNLSNGAERKVASVLVDLTPPDPGCGPMGIFSCPSVLSATSPTEWGKGTEQNPFCICTARQLQNIGDTPELMTAHFKLMRDIDLSRFSNVQANTPIGPGFRGVFDGNGHTVSHTNRSLFTWLGASPSESPQSWAGAPFPRAVVKNLRIQDAQISTPGPIGAVADLAALTLIQNVRVSANVRVPIGAATQDFVGGIVGRSTASVLDAVQILALSSGEPSEISTSGRFVGGIVGYLGFAQTKQLPASQINQALVSKLHLTGASFVGGIAGKALESAIAGAQLSESVVTSTLATPEGGFVGGIAGMAVGALDWIRPTCLQSLVTGGNSNGVGGLIGKAAWTRIIAGFSQCQVVAQPGPGAGGMHSFGVGGLLGVSEGASLIESESSGQILSGMGAIGGLVGSSICPNLGYDCSLIGGEACVPASSEPGSGSTGLVIRGSRFSGTAITRDQATSAGGLVGQINLFNHGTCAVKILDSSVVGTLLSATPMGASSDQPRWGGLVGLAPSTTDPAGALEIARSFFGGDMGDDPDASPGPHFDCMGGVIGDFAGDSTSASASISAQHVYYKDQAVPATNPGGACKLSEGPYDHLLAIDPRTRDCPSGPLCPASTLVAWNDFATGSMRRLVGTALSERPSFAGFDFGTRPPDQPSNGVWMMPSSNSFNRGMPIPAWCAPVMGGSNGGDSRVCRHL
jgi:hypothetical protein